MWKLFSKYHTAKWLPWLICVLTLDRIIVLHFFSGIAALIVAWSEEDAKIPYWRVLKSGGEVNAKYPGGLEVQRGLLEAEGHSIIQKGKTKMRYYVQDFQKKRYSFDLERNLMCGQY